MSIIVKAQSACEAGWVAFNGAVEVTALNPLQDGRPPTVLAADTANGLPSCAGGYTWSRVGRIRNPSDDSFDYARGFWRFSLTNLPAGGTVRFRLGIAPSLSGILVTTGNPELYWLDFTGPFPEGPPNGRGIDFPEFFTPPIRELIGPVDIVTTPVNATDYLAEVDVTSQFNQAIALGLADFWLGVRVSDEADDSTTVSTHFTIVTAEFPITDYRPMLIIDNPVPVTVVPPLITGEVSVLEPCVSERGFTLIDSRERQDFEIERRIHYVPRGNIVSIEVRVRDNRARAGGPAGTPPAVPILAFLTLIAPDGSIVLNDAQMTQLDPGAFQYGYQTQITDPLGVYVARVRVEED